MCFRIFTENFDYNLRFLILIVPYDSLICISAVLVPYRTWSHGHCVTQVTQVTQVTVRKR